MADRWQSDIGEWRRQIDSLDNQLIRILNDRARCAVEIGRIKRQHGLEIYDPPREEEIILMMLGQNRGPLDDVGVRRLFERIIDESRRVERLTAERENRRFNLRMTDDD
jgi:chorismate mutase